MSHETMITTLRQDLLEHIGEWLDSKTVTCEENYMGLGPNEDKDDELHIKMADAAMKVYCNALGLAKNEAKKVSDFIVLDKIAEECGEEGIVMLPTIISGNATPKGGKITFGLPNKAMRWFIDESHHFILYGINKADFKRIKTQLENETTLSV